MLLRKRKKRCMQLWQRRGTIPKLMSRKSKNLRWDLRMSCCWHLGHLTGMADSSVSTRWKSTNHDAGGALAPGKTKLEKGGLGRGHRAALGISIRCSRARESTTGGKGIQIDFMWAHYDGIP